MIYKPLPMSKTSMRREVEVSQLQFAAASAHTKLLYRYLKRNMPVNDIEPMVVRKVRMDEEKLYLVEELHKKAPSSFTMSLSPREANGIYTAISPL